jgi:nitrogen fixation/metabolism regulation signal transduction histidine kinase
VERYFLHRQNIRLAAELRRSNEELKALNESFEGLVEEKVNDLIVQNNILACSQHVLDSLPVAVIGTNADGLIVLCNKKGNGLFLGDRGTILGMDRRDALPAAVNNIFGRMDGVAGVSAVIVAGRKRIRVKGTRVLYPDGGEGAVLVFDWES